MSERIQEGGEPSERRWNYLSQAMNPQHGILARVLRPIFIVVLPALTAWWLAGATFFKVHPELVKHPPPRSALGALQMTIRLPGTCAGIPEPLLTCGEPGKAVFVYIRIVGKTRVLIGVDIWGQPPVEGPEFSVPSSQAQLNVIYCLPVFFPDEKDFRWNTRDVQTRRQLLTSVIVKVDGVERISVGINYPMAAQPPIYIGANPIGGSVVSDFFTGTVVQSSQSL
jgi:hypothetical protein